MKTKRNKKPVCPTCGKPYEISSLDNRHDFDGNFMGRDYQEVSVRLPICGHYVKTVIDVENCIAEAYQCTASGERVSSLTDRDEYELNYGIPYVVDEMF